MQLKKYLSEVGLTQVEFAAKLEVTPGAVWQWINGYGIAPENALKIERATEGRVTRHELRPDIYPQDAA